MAVSNVERLCVYYQNLFLTLDHVKVAEKLRLKFDENFVYIPFFNISFSVNRHTADVAGPVKNHVFYLLILHHLYFHKADAENSGNMVAFSNLCECSNFEPAYRKMTLVPFASYFDRKIDLLKERVLKIGGQLSLFGGDVSFAVNAFPCIPLQFIFWDGDEEFPANANILFDKNIAQFIHPESISVLANAGVNLLMENC
ncbi:MAG: DUF3786 domain-containing protein [Nitrososphaerota archaeon]|jgi:hypothetical protein|nr:DUF3786 domain-containing protein [Nitrososphaerota archaeon]